MAPAWNSMSVHCPNCLAPGMQPFYDSPGIPVA
jgi:hypothetical protein